MSQQPPQPPYQHNPYAAPGMPQHAPQGQWNGGAQQPKPPARFGFMTGAGMVLALFLIIGGVTGLVDALGNGDPFAGQDLTPELREIVADLVTKLQEARMPWLTGIVALVQIVAGGAAFWTAYHMNKRSEKARVRMGLLAPGVSLLALVSAAVGGLMTYRMTNALASYSEGLLSDVDRNLSESITSIFGATVVFSLVIAIGWGCVKVAFWLYMSGFARRSEVAAHMQRP